MPTEEQNNEKFLNISEVYYTIQIRMANADSLLPRRNTRSPYSVVFRRPVKLQEPSSNLPELILRELP
jgi:hypothetical protein